MKKKIMSILLVMVLLLACVPMGVSAANTGVVNGMTYKIVDGEVTITGYTAALPAELVIPSVIEGYPVTTIREWAFNGCDSLTTVTIGDSVTTIGENAFYSCKSLASVTMGDSVTTIGKNAFAYCDSMTSFDVGVNNPDYCDVDGVLFNKDKTTLIQYPNKKGTSYTIPDSVTTIGYRAFNNCDSLITVTIGNGVTTIGDEAFAYCDSLASVTIGNGVTTIGDEAFAYCDSMTSFDVGVNNPNYCDVDGVLFNKDKTTLIQYPACKTGTSYTIPDSVTTIGYGAFYNCDSLTTVNIPASVTTIGERAFDYCSALTTVTIPDSVTTIGDYAFEECSALISITIPASVTTFGFYAFGDCSALTSVIIEDGVTTIGDSAFIYCASLTSVTIPDSVTTIGESAFCDCIALASVTIPDSVTTIGRGAFTTCISLTSINIPDSVTTIGEYAFWSCDSLTSLTIGDSVTTIESWAFGCCDSLVEVYYTGTEEDRAQMNVSWNENDSLLNATWYYNCVNPSDHYSPDVDNSVMDTEQGNGLAYKFELKVNGLKAVKGNHVDFSDATVNYKGKICKVVAMGSVLSNVENKKMELKDVDGRTIIDVPVVYLTELEEDSCAFAVRIINIPEHALDRTIYARPYYVIETDKGNVTVYGKISSASCAEYM